MAINSIELQNFTVFENIKCAFSSGVNVIIGANGTGKTHLLKVIYSFCNCKVVIHDGKVEYTGIFPKIVKNFRVDSFQELHHKTINPANIPAREEVATTIGNCSRIEEGDRVITEKKPTIIAISTELFQKTYTIFFPMIASEKGVVDYAFREQNLSTNPKKTLPAVYIPAKEMLTHGGLEKDFIDRNLPFDTTLIDILNKSGVSAKKNIDEDLLSIMNKISEHIGGKVVYKNDKYYIQKEKIGSIEFSVEAEGHKKLGLIYRLIEAGHIEKGSILIWDEPEANLNPKLIPIVVDILLRLARIGVQIFLATHDYVIAKYFEVRCEPNDNLLFHSLYETDENIKCESSANFRDLNENPIISSFDALMDEVIERNMGD